MQVADQNDDNKMLSYRTERPRCRMRYSLRQK